MTVRVQEDVPSLRRRAFIREFRSTLRRGCERGEFRVVHYSLQRDHVHMIVEAAGKQALGRGMKAVGIRLAKAVNRVFGRSGPVLLGRYHVRALKSPREVRNALAYVLLNVRKHWRESQGGAPQVRLDEASSGAWFRGWSREPPGRVSWERDVSSPHTWLLAKGWRRHRRIDPAEVPGRPLRRRTGTER